MKGYYFIFFAFAYSLSFSQVSKKDIDLVALTLCNCFQKSGKVDLKTCARNDINKSISKTVAKELVKSRYSVNSGIMKRIQTSLSKNCKKYGDYILSSSLDLKSPFHPVLNRLGPQLSSAFANAGTLSEKKIDSIIISFMKKNQNTLLSTYKTPRKAMREVLRYAIINVPEYRQYELLKSINYNGN